MSRQARVGLLALTGMVLFGIVLFALANRSFFFSDRFVLRSHFNQVAGLRSGADVQFQGVSVGTVESVSLPSTTGGQIEVSMAIQISAQHIIHDSTQAQIKTEGLLGQMIVVLVNPPLLRGTTPPPTVENNGIIRGIDPFDLFEITDKALASVQRFEQSATSFERIVDDIRNGEGTLGKLVYDPTLYNSMVATANETQQLLTHLGDNAEALVALAEEATRVVSSILDKIDTGDGTIAKLLNDPAVYNGFLTTTDTLQVILADVRDLSGMMQDVLSLGEVGVFRFAQLMEAGKHNWLFKRYFEERGYMDPAPFEIREEALTESFHQLQEKERDLQLWEERLVEETARLDSLRQALNREMQN